MITISMDQPPRYSMDEGNKYEICCWNMIVFLYVRDGLDFSDDDFMQMISQK